jgi:hypothetical protein
VLYLLAAVAILSSVAILINGSSTANEGWFSAPGLVLFVVVVYWLPFGIGMASGVALRRKGRPNARNEAPKSVVQLPGWPLG